MKRWLVAALPFVAALAAYVYLKGAEPTPGLYRAIGLFARASAVAGCFFAAFQFDHRDYMRRAWLFLGSAYVFLLANAIIFGSASHSGSRNLSTAAMLASGGLIILGNISTGIGAFMVAYAWKAAGLTFTVNRTLFWAVTLGSAAVGVLVAGPGALGSLHELASGNLNGLDSLVSALGDIVALGVGGPILVTALSLRGGSLAWPWAMFVVGTFGWLVYDGTATTMALFQLAPSQTVDFETATRLFGCMAFLSAGWLQAMVLHSQQRESAELKTA